MSTFDSTHIPKYVAWLVLLVPVAILIMILVNFIESCFVSRQPLLLNLVLYIVIIALIQAGWFIGSTLHKRKPRTSVKGAFTLKSVVLGVTVSFVLILWLPMYIALFFISTRIFSTIVPCWVAVIITILPASCVIIFLIVRAHQSKTLRTMRFLHLTTIIATLILPITSLLTTVIVTESYYPVYIGSLRNTYGASCQLNTAWSIATKYFQDYYSTYGKAVPKPAQMFELHCCGIHWIYHPAFVLAKTGACGDFAVALATLLRDVLGCKTRVMAFEGWDHGVPEVMVNGTWYVFDITYTTPQSPVPANKYYEYLAANYSNIASSIKGFIDYETGEDVSIEHGFPHIKNISLISSCGRGLVS